MSESEQSKLQKVLRGTDHDDRIPSDLLINHMKSLAGDSLKDEVLKRPCRFNNCHPRSVLFWSFLRTIEFSATRWQDSWNHARAATSSNISCFRNGFFHPKPRSPNCTINKKKIDELQRSVSQSRIDGQTRSRSWNHSRSKSRTRHDICYFHRKFASRARNCTDLCKWKVATKSGNKQTDRQ